MDNGTSFGTQGIIDYRGLGLDGNYNNRGRGGYGSFAGPTANAIRIEEGNKAAAAGLENLLDQNQFTATNKNITDCCNRATDQGTNAEFRTSDRMRDLEREIAANARIADKNACDALICCKDTQKDILKLDASNSLKFADMSKQQAIDAGVANAKMATIEAKIDANKEIGELRAQLQTQQIFATCGCGCGGGVTPCPS